MRCLSTIIVLALLTGMAAPASAISRAYGQEDREAMERILNADFNVAKAALAENTRTRNVILIRVSLRHASLIIRRMAAESLAAIGDAGSVPSLVEALERNRGALRGGTETDLLQAELNTALLLALGKATGVALATQEPPGDEDVERALTEYKQWWERNKGCCPER